MLSLIRNIYKHWHALNALIKVEIKTSVASTRIGILWWIIDPVIMMFVYYFVINVIFGRGGPNYHLFILCGIVLWRFFSSAITSSGNSIKSNRSLLLQVNIPLDIIVVVQPIVRCFLALFGILIIIIFNFKVVGIHTLSILPLLIMTTLLAYGLGLYLAVIEAYFADISKIMYYILRAGFFLSPVLFPASRVLESDRVPEIFKQLYVLNPMAWIITSTRSVLLEGNMFQWSDAILLLCIILVIIQCGLFLIKLNASRIIKML